MSLSGNNKRIRDVATPVDDLDAVNKAYVDALVGGSGGTLDAAYDFGGAGAGRSITADAGAVAVTNNAADNSNVLELTKGPAGAQSGSALQILMGANASGLGALITHDGLGTAGVTGAGFIVLAATLAVVPTIPIAALALLVGVDRFMAQCRGVTNFIGNGIAGMAVARWEGELDMEQCRAELDAGPDAADERVEQ